MAVEPGQSDQRGLLEIAVDIHTDLGKLAAGLMAAHASPQSVQVLTHLSEIVGEIAKALGAGPVGAAGQPGAGAPPAEAAAAPPAPAEAPPQAAAGPPQGPRPGERPNGLHEATANMQAALASKHAAAQRALAGQ